MEIVVECAPIATGLPTSIFLVETTCKAYLIHTGRDAILVDVGDGSVFDRLASLGIDRVTDVLMTHHHRDQAQGLARAVEAGARIWVPETEVELFSQVEARRQARATANNYNVRQDRFSLLNSVPIGGVLRDYDRLCFGRLEICVVPTPGHTPGSVSLLAEIDGCQVAFTGDLIAGPGKIWSLAATQWTYNGAEGVAASILSLADLKQRHPKMLLPSHGQVMLDAVSAIDQLAVRLTELLACRGEYAWLPGRIAHPYEQISPHLLLNRSSISDAYVLLSASGKALFIDYGYDFTTGLPTGDDRAARRPWLYSLAALKEQYGVTSIDVVIPTHPHDDHVAGFNLLRRVEGAQVWAEDGAAEILTHPGRYDLPCLWYDPIPVDRRLAFERPFLWEEYTLTLYPLPGHSLYAAAIAFSVDGQQVLATGDQYQGGDGHLLNYVYQSRFRIDDFRASAALFRRLRPDLLLTGHWGAQPLTEDYLRLLETQGEQIAALHRDLLPEEIQGFGAEGFGARIQPYRAEVQAGGCVEYQVEMTNPSAYPVEAALRLVAPQGWWAIPREILRRLEAYATQVVHFTLAAPRAAQPGLACIAADLTVDGYPFGQQAEALITVVAAGPGRLGG
jgi:glyoxylase-like metal-dependent hydrolase (beta-lactamase superfamily II)